jgi:hypothetical protein
MSIKPLAYHIASDGGRPRQQARRLASPRLATASVSSDAIQAPQATEWPAPLPEAARRLRSMFPEVWARYEALLAARTMANLWLH